MVGLLDNYHDLYYCGDTHNNSLSCVYQQIVSTGVEGSVLFFKVWAWLMICMAEMHTFSWVAPDSLLTQAFACIVFHTQNVLCLLGTLFKSYIPIRHVQNKNCDRGQEDKSHLAYPSPGTLYSLSVSIWSLESLKEAWIKWALHCEEKNKMRELHKISSA